MGVKESKYLKGELLAEKVSEKRSKSAPVLRMSKKQPFNPNRTSGVYAPESLPDIRLTERQKEVLAESFLELKQSLSQVGVLTFLRLFETHPEVQGFFGDMRGLSVDELPQSKALRQHALRIMNFLEKCISRMQTPEKMDAIIVQLGCHHNQYGAPVQYIQLIGPEFVAAIKPQLEPKWDDETEAAWLAMFAYIATGMQRAMLEPAIQTTNNGSTPHHPHHSHPPKSHYAHLEDVPQ